MSLLTRALLAVVAVLAVFAAPASASFGLSEFQVDFEEADGLPATQAGSHPFAMSTTLAVNTVEDPATGEQVPDGAVRDLIVDLPAGLAGDPTATPRCSAADFATQSPENDLLPSCANNTVVGTLDAAAVQTPPPLFQHVPVYNLEPPPGAAAKLGFRVLAVPVTLVLGAREAPPYNLYATLRNISQVLYFYGSKLTVWGNPADERHDPYRGSCLDLTGTESTEQSSLGKCESGLQPKAFLTLPTRCGEPLVSSFEARSWPPENLHRGSTGTHGTGSLPVLGDCPLPFSPDMSAQPTSHSAESPSGLDVSIDVEDEGFSEPGAIAQSHVRRTEVVLPEGMTINPSQAEGLEACSEADLARETSSSAPGDGCPQEAKVGTLEVETPELPGATLRGSVYVAKPYENLAGDSLIALYLVLKDAGLGVSVVQPVRVEPDPRNGRLRAIAEEMPQVPLSRVRLHLREGGRSPLVTPPRCGKFEVEAGLLPWSGPDVARPSGSSFEIDAGPAGGSCPADGSPPFSPGFEAGTANNAAGRFSPFAMRFTRRDGDQDLTRVAATFPSGLVARLAGVAQCSDAGIAEAKAKTGEQELAAPSCPVSSRIGRVVAGAGVGSELLYVPGEIYLAGPWNGAPISAVAIVPAVAGPFDVGNVVTRFALRIDPRTAKVEVDGAASDPIPHILAGIPLKVRDVRAYVDRPDFTLNPTSCEPTEVGATLWGGGADAFSDGDDTTLALAQRFQAAGCRGLGFRPRLKLTLKGGTKRGTFPALRLTYRPRKGDAGLRRLSLRFPRSAYIEQGHFRTICTRVQFAAGAGHGTACPKGSIYGRVRAWTPLLDEPVSGPVFLRSSNHNLPDAVLVLHGPPSLPVEFEAVTRIDSVKGGLRAIAAGTPDVPLSRVIVDMRGGQKGLIVNSTDLCRAKHRATVRFSAHNGRRAAGRPLVRPSGCKKKRRRAHRAHRSRNQ